MCWFLGGNINFLYEADSSSGNIRVRPEQTVEAAAARVELLVTAEDAGVIPGPLSSMPDARVYIKIYTASGHIVRMRVQATFNGFGSLKSSFEEEATEVTRSFFYANDDQILEIYNSKTGGHGFDSSPGRMFLAAFHFPFFELIFRFCFRLAG